MGRTLEGTGVGPGVGYGPALRLVRSVPEPPQTGYAGGAEAESGRAVQAMQDTAAQLRERGEKAGGEARDVLSAQALMAEDPSLADDVRRRVAEGTAAPRAVYEALGHYRDLLAGAGGYMAERAADLDDVRDRIVARLLGVPMPGVPTSDTPFVLVARDLAPADTATLDPAAVLAFVTREGGPTSHTAILARSLGLPAVVAGPEADGIADGTPLLVDGGTGRVVADPDPAEAERALAAQREREAAASGASGPGRTRDGHPVPLLANIGGPADLPAAVAAGAEGIGLYRTEFLFLDRTDPPGRAEQAEAYRAALDAFPAGAKVVVRTLDAGADKPLAFLPAPGEEPNPALGERGLRMGQRHTGVLDGQLAALADAARGAAADLWVMAPMVTDAADADWFAGRAAAAGIAEAGVMIEVPAAALRARHIAESAAFFSIGTNDLTQYACAADREVGGLSRFQDPWQPAVLELVARTAQEAAAAERPCGVCGEAAADPLLACVLAGAGVTTLSMGAPALAMVRAALSRATLEECRAAAAAAVAARGPDQARDAARAALPGPAALGL
ncbi:phosphoenolpyruvate--protein phosphotransferase [Nocardiopsis coralliicola]